MAVLFDFRCSKGHIHERITDSSVISVQCPVCEEKAFKIISAVNFLLIPYLVIFLAQLTSGPNIEKLKLKKKENRQTLRVLIT